MFVHVFINAHRLIQYTLSQDISSLHLPDHRECWKAEFECLNGQCIRPGRVCDGHPHCKDGSDELQCGEGEMFSSFLVYPNGKNFSVRILFLTAFFFFFFFFFVRYHDNS